MGQANPLGAAQGARRPQALQLDVLHELRRSRSVLYRCWQVKEGIRDLYRLRVPLTPPTTSTGGWRGVPMPDPPFVTLSKTVRNNRERVWAAVELGTSYSKLEGLKLKDPPHQPPR